MKRFLCTAITTFVGVALIGITNVVMAACPPKQFNQEQLVELKTKNWALNDAKQRQQLALDLLPCLSDQNPQLRDGIAFEALSFWMRGELLDVETVQQIRQQLLNQIRAKTHADDQGFAKPFAALVLAEVARVDRKKAFMSAAERQEMLEVAATYLSNITDYRGFDEKQGWRHGVAHAADWMMQLSLNPALNPQQQNTILDTLATQIRTEQHFYQYAESERLMMPILFLALRPDVTQEEWQQWFEGLLKTELDLIKTSQESLARKHNVSAFLMAMYRQLQESKNAALREKLLPLVRQALTKLG
jgi:hypothetical protein